MVDDASDPPAVETKTVEIEAPDEPDIAIPTRRRRASDDDGEDEFHDAAEGDFVMI